MWVRKRWDQVEAGTHTKQGSWGTKEEEAASHQKHEPFRKDVTANAQAAAFL